MSTETSPNPRYSYSQISTYAACPLKYKLRYVDNLTPLQEGGQHDLRFGKAIHNALAVLYGPGGSVRSAREAFAAAYPVSEYPFPLPAWSQGKSFQGGCAALTAYGEFWREEDTHWQVIAVEQMGFDDGEERRMVKLDMVVRDSRDGLVYGVDHKVTGKYLDANYWAAFDPHSQIRQYVDWLTKQYGRCGGFYMNALSLRYRSKSYTPRSGPDKGVQLPAGDWYAFKRMCFNPNAEALALESDSYRFWVNQIQNSRSTGAWGYNTDHCVRGPIFCEYHGMCSKGYSWPQDRELIEAYYRERCPRLAKEGERCQLAPHGPEIEHDSTAPVREDPVVDLAEDVIEEAEE